MSFVRDVQQLFRRERMHWMAGQLGITANTTVLDVGGTAEIWDLLPVRPKVVLLNMARAMERPPEGFVGVAGDGTKLPFRDQSFDLVFSNSVIEHVGDATAQARFAEEVRRVGRGYWVQTPNRWFPVEQHLLTPLVHLLPKSLAATVVRRFTVWQWLHHPSEDRREWYVEHFLRDIRLLTADELARLFPDARLRRERFLLFTKSLIAWRKR